LGLAFRTLLSTAFSVSKGGDWIDLQAGKALGQSSGRMCSLKEKGIDLKAPKDNNEEAITIYYKALIEDALKHTVRKIGGLGAIEFPEPLPIILSGGSSLAKNFVEVFKEQFEPFRKKFGFEIGDIRPATNPLNAVAEGLLMQSLQEYDG
jgi:hypothetical protein